MKFYKLIGSRPTELEVQKYKNCEVVSDFAVQEAKIADALIQSDGYINGSLLGNILFPIIENKIFISHAHNEEAKAICVAKELGENQCFIDKQIWASADKILLNIQRKVIAPDKNGRLAISNLNALAAHFYCMLSNALQITITHSRAFLYIPASQREKINGTVYQYSPWINYELLQAKSMALVRRKMVKESTDTQMNFSKQLDFLYEEDDSFMTPIDFDQLKDNL